MVTARISPLVRALRRAAPAVVLAAALWPAAAPLVRAAEAGPFMRIGTGGEAGSEFVVGQVLAETLQAAFSAASCGLPDCAAAPALVVAQLSAGSMANIEDLRDGRVELALVAAPVARWAQRGEGPFAAGGPVAGLRSVATLYPVLLQTVALADENIRRIEDLRGRRVSPGGEGSATRPIAGYVLAAYGLGAEDFRASDLEPGIALERLAAGRLDVFFALGAAPLAAISRLGEIADVRLLPVSAERLAGEKELAGVIRPASLPAGTYAGMAAVDTIAMSIQLLVAEDLSEDLVYAVTSQLWGAGLRERLQAAHPLGTGIALERALDGLEVPLHPGAARYYRERGLLP